MKNILAKERGTKIFILTLIFVGIIGALSIVNAADETINLVVGKSTTRNPGLTSLWGGYPTDGIEYVKGDKSIVDISYSGAELKGFYEGKIDMKFTAKKAGQCTIKVTYYPSFWENKETKTYNINVEPSGVKEIKVTKKPLKDVYNPGDKIDLQGIIVSVTNNDGTSGGTAKISDLKFSPTVAPNEGGKNSSVTIEYKGVKTTFEIYVNPKKTTTNNNNNSSNNNTQSNNTQQTTTQSTVYTNSLKVGDKLKLKSSSGWKKYSSKSMNTSYKTMNGGTEFTVEAIDGNWITIKGESTYKYLYYGSTGDKYFSKVTGTESNSNSSSNKTETETTAPQYSNGTILKKDDVVKMTNGNSWKVYSDSSCKTVKSYIKVSDGLTYKIVSISGNILKLSQGGKEVGYIKWYNSSTGAMSYFSKVDNASPNNNVAENNSNSGKQEATTEVVSEVLNIMTKLISTILKSILQCITTVK